MFNATGEGISMVLGPLHVQSWTPPATNINTNKEFGRRSADNSHTQEEEIHCLPVHNVAEVGIVCEMHAYKFPSEAEVFPPTATEGNKPDDAFRDQ